MLKYHMWVEVVANTAQSIEWHLKQLQHIQDLLALLMGKPIRKIEIAARLDKTETGADIGQIIHILHSIPALSPSKSTLQTSTVLLQQSFGIELPQVIDAWFRPELTELWEVLRDIYFGVFYDAIGVPRYEFLALTQALESYHRRKNEGVYLSKDEFEPVRQALISAIPPNIKQDHRDSLKSRIKYGYEYSLRKRYTLLLNSLNESSQRLLGIDEQILGRIVDTRNYYTHYDPDDQAYKLQGRELEEANARLTHMMMALLLQELEIPQNLITDLLKHRKETGHLW